MTNGADAAVSSGAGKTGSVKDGIQQGRQESMRDIVYAAFEQGLSAEVIASLTHMSVDEIEKLRETSRT